MPPEDGALHGTTASASGCASGTVTSCIAHCTVALFTSSPKDKHAPKAASCAKYSNTARLLLAPPRRGNYEGSTRGSGPMPLRHEGIVSDTKQPCIA